MGYTTNGTYNNGSGQIKASADLLKDDIQSTVEHAKETVRGAAADVQAKAGDYLDAASKEISETSSLLSERIRERPLQFGAMALATGFIVAFLLRK